MLAVFITNIEHRTTTTLLLEMANLICPPSAPFYGYMGAVSTMALSSMGAVYGSVKSLQSCAGRHHRVTGMVLSILLGVRGIFMALILQGNILMPENGTIV